MSLLGFFVVPCNLVLATPSQAELFFHLSELSPPGGHVKPLLLHAYFLQSFPFELIAYSPRKVSSVLILTGKRDHVVPTDGTKVLMLNFECETCQLLVGLQTSNCLKLQTLERFSLRPAR